MAGLEDAPIPAEAIGVAPEVYETFDVQDHVSPVVVETLVEGDALVAYANSMADMLEGLDSGNRDIQVAPDFVVIVAQDETSQPLPFDTLMEARPIGVEFINARREEKDAKDRKGHAAGKILEYMEPYPTLRGFGYPEANATATIVIDHERSILDENAADVIREAGDSLEIFGKEYLIVDFTITKGMRTKRGKHPVTAELIRGTIEQAMFRLIEEEDARAIVKFTRRVTVNNWKILGSLLRKIPALASYVQVTREPKVSPIPLSNVPNRPVELSTNSSENGVQPN